MVLNFSADSVVHETNIQDVEWELEHYALEIALLGDITLARELLSVPYLNGAPVRPVFIEIVLLSAWDFLAEYPTGAERYEDKLEEMRQQQKERHDQEWGRVPEDLRRYDQQGLEACLDDETEGRDAQFADATTGWPAMLKGQRLVKAFEISVRLNCPDLLTGPKQGQRLRLQDLDETTAEIIKRIAGRWDANQARNYLAEARSLWPLYSRGILADALGMSDVEVREAGQKIYDVFRARFETGFANTQLSKKTIAELLEIADFHTVEWKKLHEEGDRPTLRSDTFCKHPATADDISGLERKLGISLPDDYKEFLSTSNGFGDGESGIFNGYFYGPKLHSTSEIEWKHESYFQLPVDLLDITHVLHQIPSETLDKDNDWGTPLPLFDRVLQIGDADIDHVWLIQPELVNRSREIYKEIYKLADERQKQMIDRAVESFAETWEKFDQLEWRCGTWAAGGSAFWRAYKSFRQYLEKKTADSMTIRE